MAELEGRTAWITGGGSGIGAAGAAALAAAGAHVVLSGRRPDALERVAAGIVAAGQGAETLPLDVADWPAVEQAARRIQDRLGRVDVLVNGAGVNVANREFATIDPADWHAVIDANLNGAFHCVRAVLAGMRERRDGVVVNVASWVGRRTERVAGPAYVSTKHALLAMTESLNMEEGAHGIRASCVCPAEVATEILDTRPVPPPVAQRARMLQPGDLGSLIRYIATLPPHVCLNEVVISPTWNRFYVGDHPTSAGGEAGQP